MIHTRATIIETTRMLFKRLFKLADKNLLGFKSTLYAIILNDLKEWEEYRGESNPKMEGILKKFIETNKQLQILRVQDEQDTYKNVNLPLTNYTWKKLPECSDVLSDNKLYYLYYGSTAPTSINLCSRISSNINITTLADTKYIYIISDDINTEIESAINISEGLQESINNDNGIKKYVEVFDSLERAVFKLISAIPLKLNKIKIKLK